LKVLGLSAQELQKNMSIDPQKTILGVLDKLNKVEKSRQIEITTQLFGKEYGDDVAKLAQGVDEYRRQLGLLQKDELKGSMSREFEKRQATAAAGWQKFKNRLAEVSITLGNALLPVMSNVLAKITPFIEQAATWVSNNKELVTTIGTVAAGAAAFSLTVSGLSFVFGGLFKSISIVSTVLGFGSTGLGFILQAVLAPKMALGKAMFYIAQGASKLYPAIGLVGTAIRGITAIMIANPIGAAIAVIAGGAYLIYNHWEGVKSFFYNMWEGVKAIFGGIVDFLKNVFAGEFLAAGKALGQGLYNGFSYFMQPIKDAFNSIVGMARGALEWLGIVEARTTPVTNEDRVRMNKFVENTGDPSDFFKMQPEAATSPLSSVNPTAGGTSTQLNYQPNITINGGTTGDAMNSFSEQLNKHKAEIARMVREEQSRNQRKQYD
jgi:cytochrome b subunit of formate dehydrogenase